MLVQRLKRLAGESLIYGLSTIIGRFISIWLTPIYTRLLTPDDYGAMSMVMATIALVQSFGTLALDSAAMRWYYDTQIEGERRKPFASWFWAHLLVALCICAIFFSASTQVSVLVAGNASIAPWLRLASITIPLGVFTSVALTWLRMQRRAWTTVSLVTGQTILQIILTFVFVVSERRGLTGIYWAQVAAGAIGAVAGLVLAGNAMRPLDFDIGVLRRMLRYSLPLIPAAIAVWIVGSVDRFFVQRYVSTAEVGIFSIGASIASLMTLVVWAFQQAWSPFALSIHEESDAARTYGVVFLLYCALGVFAVCGLSLFAPLAIRVFATPKYDRASHVVGTMAMSYLLMGLSSIVSIGFAIAKSSRPTAAAVGIGAAVTIALNALLVPHVGMIGSAIATLIGQGVQPLFLLAKSRAVYPISFPVRRGLALLGWGMSVVVIGEALLPSALSIGGAASRVALLASVPLLTLYLGVVRVDQLRALLRRTA